MADPGLQLLGEERQIDYEILTRTALKLGRAISEAGAETYRTEETVRRFLLAAGMEEAEVFAVPTFLELSFTAPDGRNYGRSARLRGGNKELDRLDLLNDLARRYAAQPFPLDDFRAELDAILNTPRYGPVLRSLAGSIGGATFACMLRAPVAQALLAIPICLVMYLLIYPLRRLSSNHIFNNLLGSACIMAGALSCQVLGLLAPSSLPPVTIGCLMNLVPGLTLTNGIRDLIASDYVAGVSNLSEAFLTATCLALGSGAVLALSRLF